MDKVVAGVGALLGVLLLAFLLYRVEPVVMTAPAREARTRPAPAAAEPERPRRIETPTGFMVYIPAGEFLTGDGKAVNLAGFYIDRYEVTNAQYLQFCRATGHPEPPLPPWDGQYLSRQQMPVINVSWEDANAYARWAGKRLPTEAEWDKAARGWTARPYPWGSTPEPTWANLAGRQDDFSRVAPVGRLFFDQSPFQVMDMLGNVSEWTSDEAAPGTIVVRGADLLSPAEAQLDHRREVPAAIEPGVFSPIGFRCAGDTEAMIELARRVELPEPPDDK